MAIWLGALALGAVLGLLNVTWINGTCNALATIFTRLFQFIAVPTIAVSVLTTLATLGGSASTGRIFRHAITYTLLTTLTAACVAAALFFIISPGNLPAGVVASATSGIPQNLGDSSYGDYLINIVPNNIVTPFSSGNVLSVLLIAVAFGIGLSRMKPSQHKDAVMNFFTGLQELLFMLIGWLVAILPIGILAYAAQLTAQIESGMAIDSLGKYTAVILGSNCVQFFVILPLFLLARGINPLKHLKNMSRAILTALFTKSSAATLPVTMQCAEERCGCEKGVSRFVLPLCTTINMNGCAAFILATSLFVMQHGGVEFTLLSVIGWIFTAVISAVGNAGVPMGCYFLTLSLMAGNGMPVGVLGIILPIYTIIDMVETAENVYSDSCVCVMVNRDVNKTE